VNENGREFLNCRWLAEAALDALAVFCLRGSFLGYLSVLGLHPFLFRRGQRRDTRKRERACIGSTADRRFVLRRLFRSFVAQSFFWRWP
jgi:hypothetical protein